MGREWSLTAWESVVVLIVTVFIHAAAAKPEAFGPYGGKVDLEEGRKGKSENFERALFK
eukprot:CAMPEP_0205921238 /NCGR_PEP_ID=MMETSP1325-20131115/12517_1 /ASSEMBLY_ACC=CAM_ASM_000708 /TAXON_ID=236786 /ORGANISM="Florenciella sp., Strain RCC1007" /LENGTH=58 /DNA_ID=CAMNT_0053289021 /DNA_START=22 /DNA_END=195 /DNA_ORIENTATION=+